MEYEIDLWLRGQNHATTVVSTLERAPSAWIDEDVGRLLADMLRQLDRQKHPDVPPDRPITLKGFSWIVNPFDQGGVLLALEMGLGAAVAGPFDIPQSELEAMIGRVLSRGTGEPGPTAVH